MGTISTLNQFPVGMERCEQAYRCNRKKTSKRSEELGQQLLSVEDL